MKTAENMTLRRMIKDDGTVLSREIVTMQKCGILGWYDTLSLGAYILLASISFTIYFIVHSPFCFSYV